MNKLKKITPQLDVNTKLTIGIVVSIALGILIYFSIFNLAGRFGSLMATFLITLFGRAAVLVSFACFWVGFNFIQIQRNVDIKTEINARFIWGVAFILATITAFLNLIFDIRNPGDVGKGGGIYGYILYPFLLRERFGFIGSLVILICIGFIGFFFISKMTFVQLMEKIWYVSKNPQKIWEYIPDFFEFWNGRPKAPSPNTDEYAKNLNSLSDVKKNDKTKADTMLSSMIKKAKDTANQTSQASAVSPNPQAQNSELQWKLPPFDILNLTKSKVEAGDVEGNKKIIKETLSHFGISVEMADTVTGPTVTQYTFKPANGVKLSTIDSLQRDMALALAVNNLRLEAPVAGQSLVGVEIPNKVKSQVRLRELLQSTSFVNFEGDLPVALGKDVAGRNLVYSLTKMPHLLVAGATGAGKSVWINSMLLSLLYRYSPKDLQMILVDMKRVELKLYEGIPHLLSNVITEAEKAINALKWTVLEMDRRYKILETYGKRNIKDYNDLAKKTADLEQLSYIVFVIDELGDLMMLAKAEVEPIVVRLTQMSRAVGIHIVLGTQRPDIHVVTGLIKANVPTRIAFAVASQIDSRVILDIGGAEKLLGQGDGLIMSPSSMKPIRFQGPNVEEAEVKRCVDFLKDQAEKNESYTNLNTHVTESPKTKLNVPGMSSSSGFDDEAEGVYDEAKRLVSQYQKASTSFLQQMMGVGYPKAAKIIQQLEDAGVVGPANGSKPRDVYITADEDE